MNHKSPIAIAIGTTLFAGLTSTAINADTNINAEANPFALTELSGGYMQTAEADTEQGGTTKLKDGSCGEGKCGGKKEAGEVKAKEGSCGDKKTGNATKVEEGSSDAIDQKG